MDFAPSDDQRLLVDALERFIARELMPHEDTVERLGHVPPALAAEIRDKALAAGYYALNMPVELGGGGLDAVSLAFAEHAFGKVSTALSVLCNRPAPILLACRGDQVATYLEPTVRGERVECFALTEPGAGSDARAITTRAVRDGDDYVIDGTKQFISHADLADFIITFAVTGVDADGSKRITAFLVDKALAGVEVHPLECVATRGYNPHLIVFDGVRVPAANILGDEGGGFAVANAWLYAGRVMLAAAACGRACRVLAMARDWASTRRQFGRPIADFQGVSFKLADMAVDIESAWLLALRAAWALEAGTLTRADASMANLVASEMIGRVTDHAVQIFGGMGLMKEAPIERFWRDARVERIWEGTSEIHRHIIARDLLRAYET